MTGQVPIFVVSLADATERRAPLLQSLEDLQIEYEVVEAVDGRDGLPDEYESWVDRELARQRLGRYLSDGEFGCAISHMKLYRRIVREGLENALILEDDAILQEPFTEFLAQRAYEDYDLIQLCYGVARVWRLGMFTKRYAGAFSLKRTVHNSGSTVAYSISNRGARFILDNAMPISLPADWPCDLSPLRPRIAVPRIAQHPKLETGPSELRRERDQSMYGKRLSVGSDPLQRSRVVGRNPKPGWYRYVGRYVTRHIPGLKSAPTDAAKRADGGSEERS